MKGMTQQPQKKSKDQKRAEAIEGLTSYQAEQFAINKNMLRLRAERLEREAAEPPVAVPASKARKKPVR